MSNPSSLVVLVSGNRQHVQERTCHGLLPTSMNESVAVYVVNFLLQQDVGSTHRLAL